jgi:hypothetical protein
MNNIGFETITQVNVQCAECLTSFTMENRIKTQRLKDGKTFYCPLGHGQIYTDNEYSRAKKEAEELKRKNQSLQSQLSWAETEAKVAKNEKTALKSQLTKTRNRVANGVCPCCHRTFKQLVAHMGNKHPEYKKAITD